MKKQNNKAQQSYVGMWVTENGYIRHELLPNGLYDEARGSKKSAYQGRYTIPQRHTKKNTVFRDRVF